MAKLLKGEVGQTIFRLALPMMGGMLAFMLFNVVDTIFIGQLGADELAAMGFCFPVIFIVMSFAMGTSVGTASTVARAIGSGDHKKTVRLATHAIFLGVLLVSIMAMVGLGTIEQVFTLLGATPNIIELIKEYMVIWYLGIGFIVIPIVGNSAIRATGDTKTPALIMLIAAVTNGVLDPLLIFGLGPFPRMELAGAALATVLAYIVTFIAGLWILGHREKLLKFSFKDLWKSWKEILYIAVPSIGTNMMAPISGGIITRLIADLSVAGVAGFGAGGRVESLALIGFMGMAGAISPFVGQNFGAGKIKRVLLAVNWAAKKTLTWGVGLFVVLVLLSSPIAHLFSADPEVIEYIRIYLLVVPLSYLFLGWAMIGSAAFNSSNKPYYSMTILGLRLLILTVPLALLGRELFGVTGIFLSISIANGITGIVSLIWMNRWFKSIK